MSKLLLGCFLFFGFTSQVCNSAMPDSISTDSSFLNKRGFVIVELFTSEGCSSCPPADKLVSEIARKADKDSTDIFILSEHVDYWNKIGWTDPFSNPFYSQRQRWYEEFFKEGSVYTPQMIVNGKSSFVGSDRQRAAKAVSEALAATNLSHSINISVNETEIGSYNYQLEKAGNGYVLNFVLVEKQAVSNVTAGENEGRVLSHINIVRDWVAIENPSLKGNITFKKLQRFDKDKFSIIAFVQNKATREIILAGILK